MFWIIYFNSYICVVCTYVAPGNPPRNIRVSEEDRRTITLSWVKPTDNELLGGTAILGYFIEVTDQVTQQKTAIQVNITNPFRLGYTYKIQNLIPMREYMFRVAAANIHGPGIYSVAVNGVTKQDGKCHSDSV